jgi:hypothetical protein
MAARSPWAVSGRYDRRQKIVTRNLVERISIQETTAFACSQSFGGFWYLPRRDRMTEERGLNRRDVLVSAGVITVAALTGNSAQAQQPSQRKSLEIREKLTMLGGGIQGLADFADADALKDVHPYTVHIINRSNWTITAFKAGAASWFNISPIGRTCYSTCQDCLDKKQMTLLMAVPCNSAAFDLYLMVRSSSGEIKQTGPARVQPDCGFAGEAICVDIGWSPRMVFVPMFSSFGTHGSPPLASRLHYWGSSLSMEIVILASMYTRRYSPDEMELDEARLIAGGPLWFG